MHFIKCFDTCYELMNIQTDCLIKENYFVKWYSFIIRLNREFRRHLLRGEILCDNLTLFQLVFWYSRIISPAVDVSTDCEQHVNCLYRISYEIGKATTNLISCEIFLNAFRKHSRNLNILMRICLIYWQLVPLEYWFLPCIVIMAKWPPTALAWWRIACTSTIGMSCLLNCKSILL